MRLSLWTLVCAGGLLAPPAEAREHELHPVASAAAIPGVMTLTPREIDVSRPDYTLVVEIRNDTDQWLRIPIQGARCVRGDLETLAEGRERPLLLAPWQARELKLRCDHGRWVTGDFGLVLPEVAASATGDRRSTDHVVLEQVTWRLREGDVTRHRQREAEGTLAHLSYCLPAPPDVEPEVPADVAIAEGPPPAGPVVPGGDRPPTATLTPR